MVAYLHDIGMVDFSPFGRAMHPEFATHEVLGDALDDVVALNLDRQLRRASAGGCWPCTTPGTWMRTRSTCCARCSRWSTPAQQEHVPIAVLNDRPPCVT